jgi:hypothetical protein
MIADLPPEPPVVYTMPSADAQGDAGISVSEVAEQATQHWQDRAEWILVNNEQEEDPYGYNSVPLEHAGTMKVKFKFIGELEPMPYDWDD